MRETCLNHTELAARCKISPRTLERWRWIGEGSGLTLIPEGDKMSLKRGTDAVNFTLLERTKRVKYIPSPEEIAREERRKEKQARSWRRNDWDSSPFGYSPPWPEYVTEWTGELVFSIDVWADGLRKTWGDGKIQRIERLVPDIVAGIELVLEFIRVRREEREDRERKWQELQRRRKLAHARVRTHNQYMTVAARAQAERNRIGHRS